MKHATYSLEFLTPAFIAGARPKKEGSDGPVAELRPPSILGQLRWWHRALGHQESEARIFGSVAGDSGRAAGFSIRIENPPPPVTSATSPKSIDLGGSYFLYVQEMDNGANLRASLPAGSQFRMILINRRLPDADWRRLLDTATLFGRLGSLGNRSRRGFGALRLLEMNGKSIAAALPAAQLPSHLACAFPHDFTPAPHVATFLLNAGDWLREARRKLKEDGKEKSLYFGKIGGNKESRLASPILLRPWKEDGYLKLLLIGPQHLILDVADTCPACGDETTASDGN